MNKFSAAIIDESGAIVLVASAINELKVAIVNYIDKLLICTRATIVLLNATNEFSHADVVLTSNNNEARREHDVCTGVTKEVRCELNGDARLIKDGEGKFNVCWDLIVVGAGAIAIYIRVLKNM